MVKLTPRSLYLQVETTVPIELEDRWAPESVWTFWRREKLLVPGGNPTPNGPLVSLVTILTELSRIDVISETWRLTLFGENVNPLLRNT
jgi:hypothetical protein